MSSLFDAKLNILIKNVLKLSEKIQKLKKITATYKYKK